MTKKLKPCPFCGEKAIISKSIGLYNIECDGCGCGTGWYLTKKEAIDVWNQRVEEC